MAYDADAAPLLRAVMAAAGHHDAATCRHLLDQATACLVARHKAEPEIGRARAAVAAADWPLVWAAAYQAICLLTWVFPPDLAQCPPRPGPHPYTGARACAGCGEPAARPDAAFCAACGAPLP